MLPVCLGVNAQGPRGILNGVKRLRLAIEGCYPSFLETDLVMRILQGLSPVDVVSRISVHDLLIRGPFSDGSRRRRWVNHSLHLKQQISGVSRARTLHVSAENPGGSDYQDFLESGCEFGVGHEIRIGDDNYFRMPHWWNYIDFSGQGIESPDNWQRLGTPIREEELMRPISWNVDAVHAAAFVVSRLNAQRRYLYERSSLAIPIKGYGKAFDSSVKDHSRSGFTKRDLLASFRFGFCPENAIFPGYYTEKIPEAFVSGAIPITYADNLVKIDFECKSMLNVYDFLDMGVEVGLRESLASREVMDALLQTPLRCKPVELQALVEFLSNVVMLSRGD